MLSTGIIPLFLNGNDGLGILALIDRDNSEPNLIVAAMHEKLMRHMVASRWP